MKMNRIISATIAAGTAAVMLLASCQRDELQGGSISGEEVSVSISATMPIDGGAVVKSNDEPGNASEVNRCIMGVYLNDDGMSQPEPMGDKVVVRVDGTTHKAEFGDLQLVSGHKYLLVFWADNATEDSDNGFEDNHYNTADFPEVTFKEGGTYKSNDDTRDAFFASYPIEVNGPSSHDIELHRPFGQLNITTNDYRTVAEDFKSLLPTQVKIDFSGIPSGIDLLTGELTENKIESLTSGPVPIADVTSPAAADGCRQLSFDYIFAPYEEEGEEQQLVLNDFTMHFMNGEDQKTLSEYIFQNIPVRRNYRTNVSGNLLTDRTGIEVEVVSDFDGEYNMDVPDVKEVTLDENTRLSQIMTEEELLQYTSLKVNGIMKEEDFEFISPAVHVFSWPDEPAPEEYHLEMLDLSGADIQIMYPIGDEGRSSRNPNNVLTKVILPEGLESIMGNTFAHCRALSEINLPSTLKTLSVGVFYYAYALTELELPDGLQSIGDACFLRSGITSVRTGTALTKLGGPSAGGVFQACEDLVSVDLSASTGLSEIMQRTFYNCSALNNVLLPNSIRAISSDAFYGCTSLKQLTLPASVESISEDSFDRISGLTLTVEAVTPPVIDGGNLPVAVFEKILVPQNSVQTYKTAVGWTDVAEKISAID